MDEKTVLNNLYATYKKHGVTKCELIHLIESGISDYNLSLDTIYSVLRMGLASAFGEREFFSLDDVQAVTGESRDELLRRVEKCRQELIEAGESPNEYFIPVPQKAATCYFPNGLH